MKYLSAFAFILISMSPVYVGAKQQVSIDVNSFSWSETAWETGKSKLKLGLSVVPHEIDGLSLYTFKTALRNVSTEKVRLLAGNSWDGRICPKYKVDFDYDIAPPHLSSLGGAIVPTPYWIELEPNDIVLIHSATFSLPTCYVPTHDEITPAYGSRRHGSGPSPRKPYKKEFTIVAELASDPRTFSRRRRIEEFAKENMIISRWGVESGSVKVELMANRPR